MVTVGEINLSVNSCNNSNRSATEVLFKHYQKKFKLKIQLLDYWWN